MSVQVFREKLAEHRVALRLADADFAAQISNRYDALKSRAHNPHPADLRRLQHDVQNWAKAYASNKDYNEEAFEAAMAWRDLLQAEIDLHVFTATAGPEFTGSPPGWVNAKTGEPVKLYAPDEKIAADRGARSDVTVGALLDGLIFGAKTPAIKAALEEGTDSAGGYSVPTLVLPQFIDRLRAKTQFINAGARVLMLDGKTRIVRTDTDPVAAWRAESSAIAIGDPSFSAVDLVPKSLAVLVKVSREVLQDSVNIQDALEASLIGAMSGELDRAAFFGAGTAIEPLGVFGIAGINSVSMGTNGGTPANYDDLLDCIYQLELSNAAAPTAAVWHPRTARTYRKLKDTTNQPMEAPSPLDVLPKLSTTSVPINQDQGTSTGVCSTVLMGDFTQAILGMRETLNIQFLRERFADTGQLAFVAHIRADVAFAHPESFVKLIGVKP